MAVSQISFCPRNMKLLRESLVSSYLASSTPSPVLAEVGMTSSVSKSNVVAIDRIASCGVGEWVSGNVGGSRMHAENTVSFGSRKLCQRPADATSLLVNTRPRRGWSRRLCTTCQRF